MRNIAVFIFILSFTFAFAQEDQMQDTITTVVEQKNTQSYKINDSVTYVYQKPKFWDFATKLPKDFSNMGKDFVRTPNLIFFSASVLATALIIPVDQQLTDNSIEFGYKRFGWTGIHKNYTLGPLFAVPADIPTAIYFFGNGANFIFIGAGILTYGIITNDYRSYHVASQLFEGILATGIVTQTIKRISGRESPNIARQNGNPGGDWNPLPSFSEYQSKTPNYDAMPSGHLATAITSIMILGENYPNQKWIKPVGFGLSAVMCFEMMQSEVHWAADYPLAIFIGYMIGKNIPKNRITKITTDKLSSSETKYKIDYTFSRFYESSLVGVRLTF